LTTGTGFLTTDDLARRWQLNTGTLRNWRCRGKGPPYIRIHGPGSPVRYALEEVTKWERLYGLLTAPRGRSRRTSGRKTGSRKGI